MRAIRLLVMLLFVLVVIGVVVALTLPADLALRYIGEPQADGTSLLKIHGQLLKLF